MSGIRSLLLATCAAAARAQCVDTGGTADVPFDCSTIGVTIPFEKCETVGWIGSSCMRTCRICTPAAVPSPSSPPSPPESPPPPPALPPPPSASPPTPSATPPPPPTASPPPPPPPAAAATPAATPAAAVPAAAIAPTPASAVPTAALKASPLALSPSPSPPPPAAPAGRVDLEVVPTKPGPTSRLGPGTPDCQAAGQIGCYGDGTPPTGQGGGLFSSLAPYLFLGLLGFCMLRYYRRAQGYNARDGAGGWGERGDPQQEGIGLVGTCLPTGSRRARNFVNDVQARRGQGSTRLAARDGAAREDDDDML